eukprot:NODE_1556_length_2438_cov_4.639983.p1 GENE.NODE_1556_length_2438_cov_4.639983~~NODE_1556_length_2438_cov_4.639983.p1  ORF type:complete len:614 (+),score=261.38 NODE_1556_length_2438_cov_4.639983:278-1843(+)
MAELHRAQQDEMAPAVRDALESAEARCRDVMKGLAADFGSRISHLELERTLELEEERETARKATRAMPRRLEQCEAELLRLTDAARERAERDDELSTAVRSLQENLLELEAARDVPQRLEQCEVELLRLEGAARERADHDDKLSAAVRRLQEDAQDLQAARGMPRRLEQCEVELLQLTDAARDRAERDAELTAALLSLQVTVQELQAARAMPRRFEQFEAELRRLSDAARERAERDIGLSAALRSLQSDVQAARSMPRRVDQCEAELLRLADASRDRVERDDTLSTSLRNVQADVQELAARTRCTETMLEVQRAARDEVSPRRNDAVLAPAIHDAIEAAEGRWNERLRRLTTDFAGRLAHVGRDALVAAEEREHELVEHLAVEFEDRLVRAERERSGAREHECEHTASPASLGSDDGCGSGGGRRHQTALERQVLVQGEALRGLARRMEELQGGFQEAQAAMREDVAAGVLAAFEGEVRICAEMTRLGLGNAVAGSGSGNSPCTPHTQFTATEVGTRRQRR